MKNILVPRLFTYKSLLQKIDEIDMGMLFDIRETLCGELDKESKVNGKYRDLEELLILQSSSIFIKKGHSIKSNVLQKSSNVRMPGKSVFPWCPYRSERFLVSFCILHT